jgi:hypothetical protein
MTRHEQVKQGILKLVDAMDGDAPETREEKVQVADNMAGALIEICDGLLRSGPRRVVRGSGRDPA